MIKIPWYKYLASYFFLVSIKKIDSAFSPGLCLQMEAGRLLLNTTNANYSYGNLHKVFEEVFELIELEKKTINKILLLGLGTGSVIDILQRQYGVDAHITAVEIDQAVINSLEFWENLDLEKTEIICGDALEEVQKLEPGFDLIIVDLFIDMDVFEGIHNEKFISRLKYLLNEKGCLLINYIVNNPLQKKQFSEFQVLLMRHFQEIKVHQIMDMNRVFELKVS